MDMNLPLIGHSGLVSGTGKVSPPVPWVAAADSDSNLEKIHGLGLCTRSSWKSF